MSRGQLAEGPGDHAGVMAVPVLFVLLEVVDELSGGSAVPETSGTSVVVMATRLVPLDTTKVGAAELSAGVPVDVASRCPPAWTGTSGCRRHEVDRLCMPESEYL